MGLSLNVGMCSFWLVFIGILSSALACFTGITLLPLLMSLVLMLQTRRQEHFMSQLWFLSLLKETAILEILGGLYLIKIELGYVLFNSVSLLIYCCFFSAYILLFLHSVNWNAIVIYEMQGKSSFIPITRF